MIGRVRLRVADADRVRSFYERTIGLRAPTGSRCGVDGTPLVELIDDPDAPPAPPGRPACSTSRSWSPTGRRWRSAVRRVVGPASGSPAPPDHFVSEALYLRDPEGNGIEIYRDRPRAEWEYEPDGELRMGTVALDLDSRDGRAARRRRPRDAGRARGSATCTCTSPTSPPPRRSTPATSGST